MTSQRTTDNFHCSFAKLQQEVQFGPIHKNNLVVFAQSKIAERTKPTLLYHFWHPVVEELRAWLYYAQMGNSYFKGPYDKTVVKGNTALSAIVLNLKSSSEEVN